MTRGLIALFHVVGLNQAGIRIFAKPNIPRPFDDFLGECVVCGVLCGAQRPHATLLKTSWFHYNAEASGSGVFYESSI